MPIDGGDWERLPWHAQEGAAGGVGRIIFSG